VGAVRVPDGYVSAHANQSRIRTFPLRDPDNALYAPDLISFARAEGYFKGKDSEFSFQDAYQPMTFEGLRSARRGCGACSAGWPPRAPRGRGGAGQDRLQAAAHVGEPSASSPPKT